MMLVKSSASAGAGEVILIKSDPGKTSILENQLETEEDRPIRLKGWNVTNDEAVAAALVELYDEKGGRLLAKVAMAATPTGAGGTVTQFVPQGIEDGVEGIHVFTGEIMVKRSAGKSTVTVYYEQV